MASFATRKSSHITCKQPRSGWWQRIRQMVALATQRRNLARLDDHLLSDIGLTRHQARQEAQKKAWDVPASWRD